MKLLGHNGEICESSPQATVHGDTVHGGPTQAREIILLHLDFLVIGRLEPLSPLFLQLNSIMVGTRGLSTLIADSSSSFVVGLRHAGSHSSPSPLREQGCVVKDSPYKLRNIHRPWSIEDLSMMQKSGNDPVAFLVTVPEPSVYSFPRNDPMGAQN